MTDCQDLAVIGLSCRFPGDAANVESFWKMICSGKSAWSKVPENRFNISAFSSEDKRRSTSITEGGHFLRQNMSAFDAGFFGLPKRDADAIDPQQRIMMEVAYEALEGAGIGLQHVAGTKTGIFMGHFTSDYRDMICRDPDNAPMYTFTGTGTASLANRISWLWDLRGPSFTVNTACSSSMVALHLACQSLRTRECEIAIVGGSSYLMNPDMFLFLSNQGLLSPDGLCKSFDESANGYGRGEGFGCIILKRVDDAVTSKDPIRAIIRGTASNQDGRTKGFTMPSAEAQMALIREVYKTYKLDFNTTAYVEAHGTGTQAGDSQEMASLANTIAKGHDAENKLIVGSVKSNIGHLEAAAGIASVIKAVVMLETGIIPPSIHFKKGNHNIRFDDWNIKVPTELSYWPTSGIRRISINSFGYGGSNAHAVLDDASGYLQNKRSYYDEGYASTFEQASNGASSPSSDGQELESNYSSNDESSIMNELDKPQKQSIGHEASDLRVPSRQPRLFVWSAQDKGGLERLRESFAEYLAKKFTECTDLLKERNFMSKLAYTLSNRRSRLQWKTYAIASSLSELTQVIGGDVGAHTVTQSSKSPRIGFVFTGQGAQWARMGIELVRYKTFRESIKAADRFLRRACESKWSVLEELEKDKSISNVNCAEYSHALCNILQIGLVDLLTEWHITPRAVVGHSGGETAAAYAAGAISREDAWRIAYYRGQFAASLKTRALTLQGSMMVVGLSPDEASQWISKVTHGHIVIACMNSPSSTTISGDMSGIDQLMEMLKGTSIFARKLVVDSAYHSPHMQVIAEDYAASIADVQPILASTSCSMYSSVTGSLVELEQLVAGHWANGLVSPVRFSEAVYEMLRPRTKYGRVDENAVDVLVEIGPHSALQGPSTQSLKANGISGVPYYSALARNKSAIDTIINLVGDLFTEGCDVNICEANNDGHILVSSPLHDLPPYTWNHSQTFSHSSRIEQKFLHRDASKSGLLGLPVPSFAEGERTWRFFIRPSEQAWILDHRIQGATLYPGAGYIAMVLEAAAQTADKSRNVSAYSLRDIQLTAAAIVGDVEDLECILQLRPHKTATRSSASMWTEFTISTSSNEDTLIQNCRGLLNIEYESASGSDSSNETTLDHHCLLSQYANADASCDTVINPADFYTDLRSLGLEYGPLFTNVCEIRNKDGESVGQVQIPHVLPETSTPSRPSHVVHPATLDAVFHLVFAAVKGGTQDLTTAMVPKFIESVTISNSMPARAGTRLPGFSTAHKHGLNELEARVTILDEKKLSVLIIIEGFLCAEIGKASSPNDGPGKRSIASKLTWQPAIHMLTQDELTFVLKDFKGKNKLLEVLKLLHHSNPSMSAIELVPEVDQERGPSGLVLCKSQLEQALTTWNFTLACRHEGMKATVIEQAGESIVEIFDFSQEINTDTKNHHDILIATDLSMYEFDLASAVGRMCNIVKPGGKACFLVPAETEDTLISILRSKFMETAMMPTSKEPKKASALSPNLSLIVATKPFHEKRTEVCQPTAPKQTITIIQAENPTDSSIQLSDTLARILRGYGYGTEFFSWTNQMDTSSLAGKSCVSLLEAEQYILLDLDEGSFERMKMLLLETNSLLWLTALDGPGTSMIDGLTRAVRNEAPGLNLKVLHATENDTKSIASITLLSDIVVRAFLWKGTDNEFRVNQGILEVSRIAGDADFNDEIASLLPRAENSMQNMPLREAPGPIKLCVASPGMLSSICLEPDDTAERELEAEYIEIDVKATALNFREVLVAMGQMPDSKLGLDAAGVIRRVGASVTEFKIGDRVAMCSHGAHRTVHRARASNCALIPDNMSFEEAATIPTVHATAWNALVRVAQVQKGQSILIHAAAGGVGQVAVQIARHTGMEIFATVSSKAKRKLLREEYGIPDNHIFNSRELGFAKAIMRMTNGRGVDVVLNSLAGEALRLTWHCIAPFGHFVEIGLRDIISNTGLDMLPFMKDATFSFFNLAHLESERPDVMSTIVQGAFQFLRSGITRLVTPIVSYPISRAEDAFRLMQSGKHVGKIALIWSEDDIVQVAQPLVPRVQLDPQGVYLLVGGLGGLGRSLSSHLVSLGARRLSFLSRSGAESANAKSLIQQLRSQGVSVQVQSCDVSDSDALAMGIASCQKELGMIRGVFHCAMVLRDNLFANMTHQEWVDSTRPKVQGSWNLHRNLPDGLDFFIQFSSFTATIGNRGQSNYTSGGAYQDALAYYRRARGQHAITIDLGIMRDIGVLAEEGMTQSFLEWEQPYGIREKEFLAIVERSIAHDTRGSLGPQVLTGMATGGSVKAAGISMPYYMDDARFSLLSQTGIRGSISNGGFEKNAPVYSLIAQATSVQEAVDFVQSSLVQVIAKMLNTTASEIDTSRCINSFGIDSLVAIEIVTWALKEVKSTTTVFDVLAGLPITTFCARLTVQSSALPSNLLNSST